MLSHDDVDSNKINHEEHCCQKKKLLIILSESNAPPESLNLNYSNFESTHKNYGDTYMRHNKLTVKTIAKNENN